jgi:hypothetical protein
MGGGCNVCDQKVQAVTCLFNSTIQYDTAYSLHIHWRISTQIQYVVQLPMEISVDHLHVQMKFVGVAKSPIK